MREPAQVRRGLDRARERLDVAVARLRDEDYGRSVGADDWTVRDVLNHVAAWDEVAATTVRELAAGIPPTRYIQDVDAFNAQAVAAGRGRSPAECRAAVAAARRSFLAELDRASPEAWTREMTESEGRARVSIPIVCNVWTRHDEEHAAELEALTAHGIGA